LTCLTDIYSYHIMTEKLFHDFPPVSTQEWEDQIIRALKGADYEKKLVWKTPDGLRIRPYYREEDLKEISYLDTLPGQKPFLRGTREDNNWLIRQGFIVEDSLQEVNARVLAALDRGVESVGFRLDPSREYNVEDMKALLAGIFLPAVEISFAGVSCDKPQVIHAFLEYLSRTETNPSQVRARFEFDPLGDAFFNGTQPAGEDLKVLKNLVEACSPYPQVRIVSIPGCRMQDRGSGIVQELAFSMAMGYEYIRLLTGMGISQNLAVRSIHFHMGMGSHYFLEIAKFRAARIFWSQVADSAISVHATASFWTQTAYDMYVNLLRGTTQAMSAAIAGVDSMEVLPYDCVIRNGSDQSYRLARNIQIILKEEAHFDQVTDPAAGSYYVENLTDSILKESRKMYGELLQKGGFLTSQGSQWVRDSIDRSRERRMQNLATRKEILVGVNQYPDPDEKAPEGLSTVCEEKWLRAAAGYEKMRLRTEQAGEIPAVFLLTFGNLAMCRARAQFAANFFGVAGFRIMDNNRFATVEEGVQAALSSGARIVVACSSDEEYEHAVPLIAESLGDDLILTVAGDPPCKDALVAQGINHFISLRSNVLETLHQYQNELGL